MFYVFVCSRCTILHHATCSTRTIIEPVVCANAHTHTHPQSSSPSEAPPRLPSAHFWVHRAPNLKGRTQPIRTARMHHTTPSVSVNVKRTARRDGHERRKAPSQRSTARSDAVPHTAHLHHTTRMHAHTRTHTHEHTRTYRPCTVRLSTLGVPLRCVVCVCAREPYRDLHMVHDVIPMDRLM